MKSIVLCDSFHAVLAWSCGLAKCQCCIAKVMVVVYWKQMITLQFYVILEDL